jgi:hypothetical protein
VPSCKIGKDKVFGFAQWDSPLALVLEVALSLVIVGGLLLLVRRVNAQAEAERRARNSTKESTLESGTKQTDDQHAE